jgi:hypothetical protein
VLPWAALQDTSLATTLLSVPRLGVRSVITARPSAGAKIKQIRRDEPSALGRREPNL